jgi:hypothetical protein
MRLSAIAAALLLCASAAADSTLYRWVDKNGNVHYGDDPAANAQRVNPNQLDGIGSSGGSVGAEEAQAAKQQAECKKKSDDLARYQNAISITETDALGNSREYSAEQKDQLVANTQKYIDQHCSAAAPPPPS